MADLKEACGVFGIYDLDGGNVVPSVYYGLTALQHRGQESCGLAVSNTSGEIGIYSFIKTWDWSVKFSGRILWKKCPATLVSAMSVILPPERL